MDGRAAFPETRIIIVLGNLLESELFVIIRAHPFRPVDGALFQRRIDVAASELLRHHTDLLQHLAGNAADAEFEAGEIGNGLDLLAEPAAHLGSGIAARKTDHAEFLEELVAKLHAAALVPPRILLAGIEPEWHRGIDRECRVLADV